MCEGAKGRCVEGLDFQDLSTNEVTELSSWRYLQAHRIFISYILVLSNTINNITLSICGLCKLGRPPKSSVKRWPTGGQRQSSIGS